MFYIFFWCQTVGGIFVTGFDKKRILYVQLQIFRNTDLNIKCCVSRECTELLPCNSPPFYSYTFGVMFNGLLAELPAILDSFLPVPQVIT